MQSNLHEAVKYYEHCLCVLENRANEKCSEADKLLRLIELSKCHVSLGRIHK